MYTKTIYYSLFTIHQIGVQKMSTDFRALQLKARHQVYTLLSGHNLSRLHGEGYDFAELREYQIGDDIRKINWTITAKLGKPYIKELHASRELSVVVAAMMDGGVYFGEDNAKQQTMTETAMLLGYATQHNGDLFTGIAYLPNRIVATPPTKQLYHIEQFTQTLYEASLLHTTLDTDTALRTLFGRLYKPSLLFVIGDFLEETDLSLLAQRHEVIAVIVRHTEEDFPRKLGEVLLHDPKSTKEHKTFFAQKSIQRYTAHREAHDARLAEHFARYDIRSVKIYTDESPLKKLLPLFR